MIRTLSKIVVVLVSAAFAVGCQSPEDARRELAELDIPYTQEAFIEAAKNEDTLAVKLFLAAGINPNPHVIEAAGKGNLEIVQALLQAGADIEATNLSGSTPLIIAAGVGQIEAGRFETVQVLLNEGADVNAKSKGGRTVLWWAKKRGNTAIIALLKQAGAKE